MITVKVLIVASLYINAVVCSQFDCFTPNGEQAHCIPLQKCRILRKSMYDFNPRTQRFLRESSCSFGRVPFVCCGSVAGYERRPNQNQISQEVSTQPPFIRRPSNQNTGQSSGQTSDPKQHRNFKLLPQIGQCGQQILQDKIVGGTETELDEFPWLALLRYKKQGRDEGFRCGGMLINNRYVLTAAHCITGAIKQHFGNAYEVRLGEHDTRTVQDCRFNEGCNEPPQDAIIEEAIFHKGYDEKFISRYNDIGLVRLRDSIKLSDFIQPICLPLNGERTAPGKNMTVAGWGQTEVESMSPIKQKASIPAVSQSECGSIYSMFTVSDNQFCAGGQKGVDSCRGDSGGPIMNLLSDRETWYAEGVVSFGPKRCGTENFPGMYTRIYGYLNWILDNMRP